MNKRLSGTVLSSIGPGHPLAGAIPEVEVVDLQTGSPGLRKGNIIDSTNRAPVDSIVIVHAML